MNLGRINIILLHTWYHFLHSMETWVDLFWNSAVQMIVFVFIAKSLASGAGTDASVAIVLGMIFWNIIWTGQYAIAVGALWEIWSRSFSSLFITPLSINEFLVGQMISGFIKSVAAFTMAAAIGYWLYNFSIFTLGAMLSIYYLELLVFSWAAGFFVLSLILRYGTDVQAMSWALIFLVQPFGGVFYPASVLPQTISWIGYILPTTYVFDAIRAQLASGSVSSNLLIYATLLNLLYLVLGYFVLHRSIDGAKRTGAFARMEG